MLLEARMAFIKASRREKSVSSVVLPPPAAPLLLWRQPAAVALGASQFTRACCAAACPLTPSPFSLSSLLLCVCRASPSCLMPTMTRSSSPWRVRLRGVASRCRLLRAPGALRAGRTNTRVSQTPAALPAAARRRSAPLAGLRLPAHRCPGPAPPSRARRRQRVHGAAGRGPHLHAGQAWREGQAGGRGADGHWQDAAAHRAARAHREWARRAALRCHAFACWVPGPRVLQARAGAANPRCPPLAAAPEPTPPLPCAPLCSLRLAARSLAPTCSWAGR